MLQGFPGGSEGKEFACNAGDQGSIPGSGRYPGKGNGNPLLYSCLEISMDSGMSILLAVKPMLNLPESEKYDASLEYEIHIYQK